jgi:hypothetical protein
MQTYSFSEVMATIMGPNGSFPIGQGAGVAEEGITIEPTEKTTMLIGADGNFMHSKHADQSGRCIIRLLKTSPTNALLSSLYGLDDFNPGTFGQNVITVSSLTLLDQWVLAGVGFSKFPNTTYARAGGIMEWEFQCGRITRILGNGGISGIAIGSGIANLGIAGGGALGVL